MNWIEWWFIVDKDDSAVIVDGPFDDKGDAVHTLVTECCQEDCRLVHLVEVPPKGELN